jgi:signal transduction histidine kinase/PAS domain-containing protein
MSQDFLNLNEENKEALSDRLLRASASATNVLLTIAPLDDAVNTALKIIGEALDTDRIGVIENFDCPEQVLPCWKTLYKWNSPYTISQFAHPEISQGTYEGIESWYESLNQGRSLIYFTKDIPEPFRSQQEKLGVKVLHGVPIFVENKCWGVVGFDDCREVKHRGQSELSVLKIIANSIGSAIQRDRTHKALLRSEQERAAELESINIELRHTLNSLKITEERFRTLFELSSEGFYFIEVDPPVSTTLSIDEQCEQLYHNIRVVEANPAFAAMYGIANPDDCIGIKNSDIHIPDSDKNAAFIRGILENRRDLETEEIDSQGQPRYFLNGGGFTSKDGYIVAGWGSQVDITQLRQTQQALLINEKQRTAELEKINETLSRSLTWLAREENLNNFLEQILLEISATMQADLAHLFVLHQPDRMLEVVARVIDGQLIQNPSPFEPAIFSTPFSADITPLFSMMEEQNLFLIVDMTQLPSELNAIAWPDSLEWHIRGGYKACASLVLKTGDRSVGFLGMTFNEKQELVEEKRQLVIALANQAALAILLLQLAEQSKQAALFEERNRLAGEIHDTLAQAFTGISLQLGVAKWLLNKDPTTIEPILDRINDIAQSGLAEARRSVWEIYPTAQKYANLAEKLSQHIENVKQTTHDNSLQIDFQILGTAYQVSAIIGYNLLKIAQEAIVNALKHAKPKNLSIVLTYKSFLVSLEITDDGCGFQPSLDNGGFGVLSMSERNDRLGGQLSINSILGQGTEILVEIPLGVQNHDR